jgi:hypothetical protein
MLRTAMQAGCLLDPALPAPFINRKTPADRHLHSLATYGAIRIMTPAVFLASIAAAPGRSMNRQLCVPDR